MKIRKNRLWQLPVYYLAASWLSFYVLMAVNSLLVRKTVNSQGLTELSRNPLISHFTGIGVLLAVLLLGGLFIAAKMSRAEAAVSAGVLTLIYFIWVLLELISPGWDRMLFFVHYLMTLNGELNSLLFEITGNLGLSALLSCLTPLLFIPFGKKNI